MNAIPPPEGDPREVPTLPPPPKVPSSPAARAWFYAAPVVIDALAMICTTILVALGKLPVEAFKYLVGVLVVGNVAMRFPGVGRGVPPGGGGFIMALASSVVLNVLRGFRS